MRQMGHLQELLERRPAHTSAAARPCAAADVVGSSGLALPLGRRLVACCVRGRIRRVRRRVGCFRGHVRGLARRSLCCTWRYPLLQASRAPALPEPGSRCVGRCGGGSRRGADGSSSGCSRRSSAYRLRPPPAPLSTRRPRRRSRGRRRCQAQIVPVPSGRQELETVKIRMSDAEDAAVIAVETGIGMSTASQARDDPGHKDDRQDPHHHSAESVASR